MPWKVDLHTFLLMRILLKASKWILFYELPFLLPITLAIQEKTTQGGRFSHVKTDSIFPSSFLKKAAATLKKAKENANGRCSCEFISKHEIFLSMKKTAVKLFLAGFFLASGFSQFVWNSMHLYIGQTSTVDKELIYENKLVVYII